MLLKKNTYIYVYIISRNLHIFYFVITDIVVQFFF